MLSLEFLNLGIYSVLVCFTGKSELGYFQKLVVLFVQKEIRLILFFRCEESAPDPGKPWPEFRERPKACTVYTGP